MNTGLSAADALLQGLRANHPLDQNDIDLVCGLQGHPVRYSAGSQVIAEGQRSVQPHFVTRGWAAAQRVLPDGRRQILRLIIPGDVLGLEGGRGPPAWSIFALTVLNAAPAGRLVDAASAGQAPGVARALAVALRHEERQFVEQIVRLGRMSGPERVASLMLELRDRLSRVGLGSRNEFPFPLTQHMLADVLGLSPVHVNRVLQGMRQTGTLIVRPGMVAITDLATLELLAFRRGPGTTAAANATP